MTDEEWQDEYNAMVMKSIADNRNNPEGSKIKLPTKEQVIEGTKIVIGTSCFLGFILALFSTALIK